jgi:hypothetical protein
LDQDIPHGVMKNGLGISLREFSEVAAVAVAEGTLFFAVATQQADRGNGRLHSPETAAQVMLKLGIRQLALGLVRKHCKRFGRHGVRLGTKYCLMQQPTKRLKQLLKN